MKYGMEAEKLSIWPLSADYARRVCGSVRVGRSSVGDGREYCDCFGVVVDRDVEGRAEGVVGYFNLPKHSIRRR